MRQIDCWMVVFKTEQSFGDVTQGNRWSHVWCLQLGLYSSILGCFSTLFFPTNDPGVFAGSPFEMFFGHLSGLSLWNIVGDHGHHRLITTCIVCLSSLVWWHVECSCPSFACCLQDRLARIQRESTLAIIATPFWGVMLRSNASWSNARFSYVVLTRVMLVGPSTVAHPMLGSQLAHELVFSPEPWYVSVWKSSFRLRSWCAC